MWSLALSSSSFAFRRCRGRQKRQALQNGMVPDCWVFKIGWFLDSKSSMFMAWAPILKILLAVGRHAPHHFEWGLAHLRAVETTEIDDFRPRSQLILKTQQSNFQAPADTKGTPGDKKGRRHTMPVRPPRASQSLLDAPQSFPEPPRRPPEPPGRPPGGRRLPRASQSLLDAPQEAGGFLELPRAS